MLMSKSSTRKRKISIGVWLLLPGFIYLLGITLFPFVSFLIASFQDYYIPKAALRRFIGLDNYLFILKDPDFITSVIQTLKFTFIAITAEAILGFAIALLFNIDVVRFKRVWRSLLIMPMMVTPTIASFFFSYLFNENYGFVNNLLRSMGLGGFPWFSNPDFAFSVICLIDIWMWTPFVALMILAGLQSLPEEIYEAARIDGANNFQVLTRLTLPLMKNTFIVALCIKLIYTLKVFDTVAIITRGGPGLTTSFLGFLIFKRGFQFFKLGEASAMAVLFLILVTIIARLIFNRIHIERQID